MRPSDITLLIDLFNDSLHQKFAAGTLAVKPEVVEELVDRKMIERVEGPVCGLFQSKERYYRKRDVEALAEKIMKLAEEGGRRRPKGCRYRRLLSG